MFKYTYTLEKTHYKELNEYMAIHDNGIRKKMIYLMVPLCAVAFVLTHLIGKNIVITLTVGIIFTVLMVIFFPKIYWKTIFNRINKINNKANYIFSETTIEFDENDFIISNNKKSIHIKYEDIIALDSTKNITIIFYKNNSNGNLIIPNNVIGNDLNTLHEFLFKKVGAE